MKEQSLVGQWCNAVATAYYNQVKAYEYSLGEPLSDTGYMDQKSLARPLYTQVYEYFEHWAEWAISNMYELIWDGSLINAPVNIEHLKEHWIRVNTSVDEFGQKIEAVRLDDHPNFKHPDYVDTVNRIMYDLAMEDYEVRKVAIDLGTTTEDLGRYRPTTEIKVGISVRRNDFGENYLSLSWFWDHGYSNPENTIMFESDLGIEWPTGEPLSADALELVAALHGASNNFLAGFVELDQSTNYLINEGSYYMFVNTKDSEEWTDWWEEALDE